jgi:hypothetical protein
MARLGNTGMSQEVLDIGPMRVEKGKVFAASHPDFLFTKERLGLGKNTGIVHNLTRRAEFVLDEN